jgi:hypothetical protein
MLRIHDFGFAAVDAEKGRVELIGAVDKGRGTDVPRVVEFLGIESGGEQLCSADG